MTQLCKSWLPVQKVPCVGGFFLGDFVHQPGLAESDLMIWWFVSWILYGQTPFIGSAIKSGSSQWEWLFERCHSFLAQARGKEKATIGAVCKRCGRWWDPWLNFDPFVMVLTGGAVHECQPCLFNPEMWLHFGCANEANDFQFDILLLKTEQLAQQKCWVQTVFCQGLLLEMFYWLIYLSTIIKNGPFLKMCSFLFNLANKNQGIPRGSWWWSDAREQIIEEHIEGEMVEWKGPPVINSAGCWAQLFGF